MQKTRLFYENLRVAIDLAYLDSTGIGLANDMLAALINKTHNNFNNEVTEDDIDIALAPTVETLIEESSFIYEYTYGKNEKATFE